MKKKVAVIILNYKTWEETLKEIEICNNILKIDYEDIIVVDNASQNESAEELSLESEKKNFVFLDSRDNRGYAAGNNIGLKFANRNNYEYALILNNDILIEDSEVIKKMLLVFSKDENIAVVNTDVYSPDGHMFNRDAKCPSLFDYTLGAFLYKKKGRIINDLGGFAYIYRPQGCCMMVDLNKMAEIGYMDEYTFLYLEEPILAEKLLSHGYRCALCTTAKIIHNHSATVNSVLDKKKRIKIVNKSFRYYLKKYRHFNSVQISVCCLCNTIKMLFE